jgi:pyridoxamine 5'-phosphate oxidase family protein
VSDAGTVVSAASPGLRPLLVSTSVIDVGIAFTEAELEYLRSQRLARLATVDPDGVPQNNPVGFVLDADTGQLVIGGLALAKTRKFRNVQRHPWVSLVVDDVVSVDPWRVRGLEVRGTAEGLTDVDPPRPGMSREVIRITPRWIGSWGLEPDQSGFSSRGFSRVSDQER